MRRWLAALLLAAAAPAAADVYPPASPYREAFQAGRFADAFKAGTAAGGVSGHYIAGRAASTLAAYRTPDKARARALLLDAERHFEAALAADPGNPGAFTIRLQKAIAAGYRAKLDNSPGAARAVRREFEAVIAARPRDALALAAMGGWHGEAVATLGRFVAGTVLGAREKEAIAWFERALAAEGADPVVPVFYASTLLNLSAENADRARSLLRRAARTPTAGGFDALVQANGAAILKELEAGDVPAARATAARLSPLGALG
jgi:predicted Zn-dependent protease